jgi:homoserine kinase type II
MAVFTTVTPEQLGPWLTNHSIGTLTGLAGIPSGIENTNYFVTTTQGRYVLTLFEKLQAHELPFYLDLMAHLSSHGIPCPKPIADLDNRFLGILNGKPAAIVTRLDGAALDHPDAAHCAQAGTMLANLHLAGRSYPAGMPNPRGPKWWRSVMPDILPFVSAQDAALLTQEVQRQSASRFGTLPRGPIHADLFRDNVLFAGDRIGGVIDFYFACVDAWLYDVAITVNDWCSNGDGTLDTIRTGAFLDAYRRQRPFTSVERDAWTTLLRAAALRFWISRLYDYHLPRPGEIVHAKDPDHFRTILRTRVAHERDLPQLPA